MIARLLTDRQLEAMALWCRGMGRRDIAETLRVSPRSVDQLAAAIRRRTGLAKIEEICAAMEREAADESKGSTWTR
jgi:DNA-binding CsgD family transcriptional regulator